MRKMRMLPKRDEKRTVSAEKTDKGDRTDGKNDKWKIEIKNCGSAALR